MPQASLREIEQLLCQLWMRRDVREDFLDGRSQCLESLRHEIDVDGVELYAGLINHGQHELMLSIYPHSARLLGASWESIVDDYFETCPPNHYNLNRAASRFPQFLQGHEKGLKRFPFIAELADFEWIELELLEIDTPLPSSEIDALRSPDQFQTYGPIVNPALIVREYSYPIMKIVEQLESGKRLSRKVKATESFIAVCRDTLSSKCRFLEVGRMACDLVRLAIKKCTYSALISHLIATSPHKDPETTISEFLEFLEEMTDKHVFIGHQTVSD